MVCIIEVCKTYICEKDVLDIKIVCQLPELLNSMR